MEAVEFALTSLDAVLAGLPTGSDVNDCALMQALINLRVKCEDVQTKIHKIESSMPLKVEVYNIQGDKSIIDLGCEGGAPTVADVKLKLSKHGPPHHLFLCEFEGTVLPDCRRIIDCTSFGHRILHLVVQNSAPLVSIDFAVDDDLQKCTLIDGARIVDVDGTRALRIDKDGPMAKIPVDINPAVVPHCTLETWVKLNSIANHRGWLLGNHGMERKSPSAIGGIMAPCMNRTILMHDSRFGGEVSSAIGREWVSNLGPPLIAKWLHVVAVFRQGGESYVFLNGMKSSIASMNTRNHPTGGKEQLWLGRPDCVGHWVDCWVKLVRIYDYAMDEAEVATCFAEFTSVLATSQIFT